MRIAESDEFARKVKAPKSVFSAENISGCAVKSCITVAPGRSAIICITIGQYSCLHTPGFLNRVFLCNQSLQNIFYIPEVFYYEKV